MIQTTDHAIPGPDPGACPECGGWRKAGVVHRHTEICARCGNLGVILVPDGCFSSSPKPCPDCRPTLTRRYH